MPLIIVRTSISRVENEESFLQLLSNQLSEMTGKPEQYVMTLLETNVPMTFAGSSKASCYVEVKSIGSLNPGIMAATFCKLIEKEISIPANRIYISFEDIPAKFWGWDGRTFG